VKIPDIKFHQTLNALRKWCAAQERCQQECFFKLRILGLGEEQAEQALAQLISEGFINEERFARTFARGKFRIKKWGKRKIVFELKKRNISEYCVRKAMQEIDSNDYRAAIEELIRKKSKEIKETEPYARNSKLAAYLISKGYEPEVVREALNSTSD